MAHEHTYKHTAGPTNINCFIGSISMSLYIKWSFGKICETARQFVEAAQNLDDQPLFFNLIRIYGAA